MAPWKIVLQPQKVSRAARVSGMLKSKGKILLIAFTIYYNQSHFTFLYKKYKNIHGIDVPIISIDRYY